ncbi:MAG: MarR family winged helix-turn-helix transcriptional regulator [Sphingomonadales bacterium]
MSSPEPPRTYDELERYLPYLVNRLAVLGQAAQKRMLEKGGLNLLAMRTLSILHIEDGLTINEIAERTFTEQSSTSRAIDAMVSQGLVKRRIPAHDQRRREIALTDRGREQLMQSWPTMHDHFGILIEGMAAEHLDFCRTALTQMLANLARVAP